MGSLLLKNTIVEHIMKRWITMINLVASFLLLMPGVLYTQVGIGTTTPAVCAELEVYTTDKGFLPPRLTAEQRNTIANPAPGLMIWCIDCGIAGELQVYNGSAWNNVAGSEAQAVLPRQVTIGAQQWMTRNLDVTTFRNGDTIPEVKDRAAWAATTQPAWCYYNNDPAKAQLFGKIYNWYAVNDARGLAPAGWHIPNDVELAGEWNTLVHAVNENAALLKAPILWSNPGTNQTGFTALPGGYRNSDGSFGGIGTVANWWGATYGFQYSFTHIIKVQMDESVYLDFLEVAPVQDEDGNWVAGPIGAIGTLGFSVRCIKDLP